MIRFLHTCLLNLVLLFWVSVSSSALFAQATADNYKVIVSLEQKYENAGRHFNGVTISGSVDGAQSITSIASSDKVYNYVADEFLTARAGETLTASFLFTGTWMNGFVYMDMGHDGTFDATLTNDGLIPPISDILAFSYAEASLGSGSGKNSAGTTLTGQGRNVLNPPSFTLPSSLVTGYYLMRFKIDWASIDPAGRAEDGDGIIKNGGGICDVRVNIHNDNVTVNSSAVGGEVTTIDGEMLAGYVQPFGEPLAVKIAAADGYMLDALCIRHGYNLDGEQALYGVKQWSEEIIPAYLVTGDEYQILAEYIDGDVIVEAHFVPLLNGDEPAGLYPVAVEGSLPPAVNDYAMSAVTLARPAGNKQISLPGGTEKLYNDATPSAFVVKQGEELTFSADAANAGMHYYLYIDYNQDGGFSVALNDDGTPTAAGELVSYSSFNGVNSAGTAVEEATLQLPSFVLPSQLPFGVYRARLKADIDNLSPAAENIAGNGGYVVDFLLKVVPETGKLELFSYNGSINAPSNSALPVVVNIGERLQVVPVAVADGYVADELVIRHGFNLNGPQYINGNRQWSEYSVDAASYTIPADSIDGDVALYVDFVASNDAEYRLVFSDEFDGEDGTQPLSEKWGRCQRQGATWNRWLSDSEEVIYVEDGKLVARAIPNPDTSIDNVPMITGGIKSQGLFGFTYGKVECRLLSNPWTGNFPALWMMPEDQSAGWPDCGEIDIFETIDSQERSWHTIHSNWTYDLGYTGNPQSSFNTAVSLDRYHTYALEWTETSLTWYVDGRQVGKYSKSSTQSHLNQGQWPFDKHFYLILNQSVGNGSWAANADVTHTYETLFDWVRVYQKAGMENTLGTVGVVALPSTPAVEVDAVQGGVAVYTSAPVRVFVCDLSGRVVYDSNVDGEAAIALQAGIYIVNGKKIIVR